MNIVKTGFVIMAATAALAPGMARADRVQLKSGSVLVGKIIGTEGDKLKFAADDLGEIAVPLASLVKAEDAAAKPIAAAELPVVPKPPETWHGSVNFAFLASRGNTYENTASVVGNLNRRWEKDRLNFDFGYYYSENGKASGERQKTVDRWEAELKHDHFWWQKVYSYEDLRYDRDKIALLESRYRVGLGGGYQWLENADFAATGKWSFNQEFGVNWVREEYENMETEEGGFAALRYAHHLNYLPKWREGLEFFHNAEILPDVDDWGKFLSKVDVGFTTKLILGFDLLAKIEWDFDSKPADGRKKDDLRYIVGLGYKW